MTASAAPSRPEPSRVAITGVGLISPLGLAAWDTFTALLAGRTIADHVGALPPNIELVPLVRAVGSVAAVQHVACDPAVELAERAAREALTEANAAPANLRCYVGTSKGAVSSLAPTCSRAADALAMGPCGYLSHELRRRLGFGQVQHYIAACASSLYALHAARRSLRSVGDRTLVVTAESAMLPAFIHSYRRLGVLAARDDYAGRPWDRRRQGFMLAEVGAAVVLERVETVKPGQIELVDTAVATEAYDLIRPSPTMPALHRIAQHFTTHGPIDMLHPHAPGTLDHDQTELDVLHDAIAATPAVWASKGALGHTLGAAGLVSLVLACLIARTTRVPPMPWLQQPIDHPLVRPDASADLSVGVGRHGDTHTSRLATHAVFAVGFGGHVAGALVHRSR